MIQTFLNVNIKNTKKKTTLRFDSKETSSVVSIAMDEKLYKEIKDITKPFGDSTSPIF